MREFGCAVGGTILGGVAGFAVFYLGIILGPPQPMAAIAGILLGLCFYACIGAMLGTLGGLAVARYLKERDERAEQQPKGPPSDPIP